ncbi:MAG: transcriptional regulator [Leptonema illini]|jgi:CarD family transcriptional regulator|uniref:Transcriptional regulator, CarD family n=2 Tax=Leptonema illini TaxID=183 RepID=H2CFZ4_9LEPT|nr:transcriptional regulator, CarD family [Leptonema illini DSM 21528]KAB2935250.1 MAG: transcriptional regulator [Leptonema illini]PKL34816.1 MAG: transcriptional regulator [Spirochaetae bacterium HGW-Spirochaetae-10]
MPQTKAKKKSAPKSAPKTAPKPAAVQKVKKESVEETGFAEGDYIVYPMHGVGRVTGIQKQTILGNKTLCYILEIQSNKMKVVIPVNKAKETGIRAIIKKTDVKKVTNLLQKDEVDTEEDWKIRYQNNLNKIKSGSIYSVAEVCRNLYKRARDKELSLMEKRLYESAYNLITSEIAIAKGITQEEAGNLISDILS